MTQEITMRTPLLIAAEINAIKYRTGKIFFVGVIEIGRRLREAKDLIPHGEWRSWLEEEVSYSQNTAEKYMRIYKAYGAKQPLSLNEGAQTQETPDLTFTQALILLGVPKEEREQFILDMDVSGMSVRELQRAVNEKKQALAEKNQALQEKSDLQKGLTERDNALAALAVERDSLQAKVEATAMTQAEFEQKLGEMQTELQAVKESGSFKQNEALKRSIDSMGKNMTAYYNKAQANKVAFLVESLDRNLRELNFEMSVLAQTDPNVYQDYVQTVNEFFLRAIKERMLLTPLNL